MPPPPASGDLNSHLGISTRRSPCIVVMRVIVLHPYTKYEVCRPSRSIDMADFRVSALSGLATLTFDL